MDRGKYEKDELLQNLNKLHTTKLGVERIKRNLSLDTEDVVHWCKIKINSQMQLSKEKGRIGTSILMIAS